MKKETKNNHDVKRLELAHKIRDLHHKSLWEEEKHFTWWISIVLSTVIVLYTSSSICDQNRLIFMAIVSAVGFFICFIALNVMRKEGVYFHIALSRFVSEYNKIYKTSLLKPVPEKANENMRDLIKLFFTPWKLWKLGVRNSFQCLFLFFMLIFISMFLFSFLTLIVRILFVVAAYNRG